MKARRSSPRNHRHAFGQSSLTLTLTRRLDLRRRHHRASHLCALQNTRIHLRVHSSRPKPSLNALRKVAAPHHRILQAARPPKDHLRTQYSHPLHPQHVRASLGTRTVRLTKPCPFPQELKQMNKFTANTSCCFLDKTTPASTSSPPKSRPSAASPSTSTTMPATTPSLTTLPRPSPRSERR